MLIDGHALIKGSLMVIRHLEDTVNQQILAAIKFGVSQNKVNWRLLLLATSCFIVSCVNACVCLSVRCE